MTRPTQHQRLERRGGKVPKITPNPRPMLAVHLSGLTPDDALVCGTVFGDMTAQFVEATGMMFEVRKGQRRWVIGDGVGPAIAAGGFVVILDRPPEPAPKRATNLPVGAPGSAPAIPGRLDQWPVAFTPCVRCAVNPAGPGDELCGACLAAETGETSLERALRLAGS